MELIVTGKDINFSSADSFIAAVKEAVECIITRNRCAVIIEVDGFTSLTEIANIASQYVEVATETPTTVEDEPAEVPTPTEE